MKTWGSQAASEWFSCLAHKDIVEDSKRRRVLLREEMAISAFDDDLDDDGNQCWLVASGIVERSPDYAQCRGSKWSLRIDNRGTRIEPIRAV
jgi:hypothetical protein